MQTREKYQKKHENRGEQCEQKTQLRYPGEIRQRLNPRLVFNDPFEFFQDLLMEQNEQS